MKFIKKLFKIIGCTLLALLIIIGLSYWYIATHEQQIVQKAVDKLSKQLHANITLKDAHIVLWKHFPNISVSIDSILVTDSLYHVYKTPLLQAKYMDADINIVNYFKNEDFLRTITVSNGQFNMFTKANGYSNNYIFSGNNSKKSTKKKNTTQRAIDIDKLVVENFELSISNEVSAKLYSFYIHNLTSHINEQNQVLTLDNNLKMFVKALGFNMDNGSYLNNTNFNSNFKLTFNTLQKILEFNNMKALLNTMPFEFDGKFNMSNTPENGFTIKIKTQNVYEDSVLKLLTPHLQQAIGKYKVSAPLNAHAFIQGPLTPGSPVVKVNFDSKNTDVDAVGLHITNAIFSGYYYNEVVKGKPRTDPNSEIYLDSFRGNWKGIDVKALPLRVFDFDNPILTTVVDGACELQALQNLLHTKAITFNSGQAKVNVNFDGPVTKPTKEAIHLDGKVWIANGLVTLVKKNIPFTNINGLFTFDSSDLNLDHLQTEIFKQTLRVNGQAKDFVSTTMSQATNINVQLNLSSDTFDLAAFKPFLSNDSNTTKKQKPTLYDSIKKGYVSVDTTKLLDSIENKYVKNNKTKTQQDTGRNLFSKIATKIDDVINDDIFDFSMQFKKVMYEKLTATNFKAAANLRQNKLSLRNVSMNIADGFLQASGSLTNKLKYFDAAMVANFKRVDVKKTFYMFNNFGQDGITYENLKGIFTASGNVGFKLNNDLNVIHNTGNGLLFFKLVEGAIINYEPLEKIQKHIFKRRNFSDVEFAVIYDTVLLKNGRLTLPRMEIASSVIHLFVEGSYGGNTGVDMSIQFPLKNLKRYDSTAVVENIGTHEKVKGGSLWLRVVTGKDGKVHIKIDPFKHYFKNKAKEIKKEEEEEQENANDIEQNSQ